MNKEVYGIIEMAINNLPVDKARIMKTVLKIVEEWDHPSFITAVLAGELAEAKMKAHALNRELYAYKDILKEDHRTVKATMEKYEDEKRGRTRDTAALTKEINHLDVILKDRNKNINELKQRIHELEEKARSV